MTGVPRVLLLTGTPPGYTGGGGVFLRELCLAYPSESICCFAVTRLDCGSTARELGWMPMASAPLLRQHGIRRFGRLAAALSEWPVRQYVRLLQVPALAARVARFGRQYGAEMVWAVLNQPSLIQVARSVARALDAQLVTTVWDPPEYLAMNRGLGRCSRRALLREYGRVLRTSVRCGVASHAMGVEYARRYGIKPVVMIYGIHPDLRRPPATDFTGEGQFVIGFAGSWYAEETWQALFSAVSSVNWRIAGREVVVQILGAGVSIQGEVRQHVEYLGWRSVEETVALMSRVDVAYVPYWFDESHGLSVRLCFPNKLTTYLAAGRPVFFHGPPDSTPAEFLARYPAGVCCHSLARDAILNALERFLLDRDDYARMARAGQDALDQELGRHVFLHHFAELIGIRDEQLLKVD